MEEIQEKSKIVQLRNKVTEKATELGNKAADTAKQTFDHLNILKHMSDTDKTVSNNERDKAIEFINAINSIKDEDKKAELLKEYFKGNNQREIIGQALSALKYLSGGALVAVIVYLSRPKKNN